MSRSQVLVLNLDLFSHVLRLIKPFHQFSSTELSPETVFPKTISFLFSLSSILVPITSFSFPPFLSLAPVYPSGWIVVVAGQFGSVAAVRTSTVNKGSSRRSLLLCRLRNPSSRRCLLPFLLPITPKGDSILADSGTEQIEFIALSQRTGDLKYQQKVEGAISHFQKTFPSDGLLSIYINPDSGISSRSQVTFGAMGDSFYEYLLKAWVLGNRTENVQHYREMWETSMKGLQSLIRKSTPSSFTYICEKNGDYMSDKMDELACFVPGMLALGSSSYDTENAKKILSLAEELAWTCYNFYDTTPTKLAGENYFFREGQDMHVGTSWNILRPETVESLMYLWRITGNKTYKEWGWNIFQAFEKNSRIDSGYVGLKDVTTGMKDNMMQSFFLAETLKYLYLLFSPSSLISLDEWVFNTEAHPLKIVARHGEDNNTTRDVSTPPHRSNKFFGRKQGGA